MTTVRMNIVHCQIGYFILFLYIFTDHSVHAPSTTDEAWEIVFPEPAGYHIKAQNGVFNVYSDAEHMNSVGYQYIKLEDFIQDMNSICAMMADGPL